MQQGWLITLTTRSPLRLQQLPDLLARLGPEATATVGAWSGARLSFPIAGPDMSFAMERAEQLWASVAARDHGPFRLLEATGPILS